jgi:hypothetical protein
MNSKVKFFLLVMICAPIIVRAQEVAINFTTNLYTESPIKKVNSLVMKLWSHVDASLVHEEQYHKFMGMQQIFAKEMLMLNSLLDNALLVIQQQSYDHPESAEYAAHDLEHVLKVLHSLDEQYKQLMEDTKDIDVIVSQYLLKTIIYKVREVIETGHVMTPLHAFISGNNYSKEMTPLFVPAIMFPVAPIC